MQCKDSQEHIVHPPLEKPWPGAASLDGTLKHTRSILVFWMRKQSERGRDLPKLFQQVRAQKETETGVA